MEEHRLIKFFLMCSLICILFLGNLYADGLARTYFVERISLDSLPVKSCIYKVFSDKKLSERCDSLTFRLGQEDGTINHNRFIALHELSKKESEEIKLIWTMYTLPNGLLVSTKLHKLSTERLVEGGMQSVLEAEVQSMERSLEKEQLKLKTLNEDLTPVCLENDLKILFEKQDFKSFMVEVLKT